MTKEALKLALEALEVANSCVDGYYIPKGKTHLPEIELAIIAIKEALAQPEHELCTRVECMGSNGCIGNCWNKKLPQQELVCVCGAVWEGQELVVAPSEDPPQRTWVGLTDKDKHLFSSWLDHKTDDEVFTAIEAKLKEKNT